ncbi:MAG: DoxX family membrane protein [Sphaerobacteraceae bacterium]|nr:MAG: DoxX family membrane protein [Sphaerobacteraceae bacterium]
MTAQIRPVHVVLVVAIVGLMSLRYFTDVGIPGWLFFGLGAAVIIGAIANSYYDYRKAQQGEAPAPASTDVVEDPKFTSFLFGDLRTAPMWLIARVYLGIQWLDAGWGKVTNEAWMDSGVALRGFWERSVAIPEEGNPMITYDWYRDFLTFMLEREWYTWFGPMIAVSQVLVGVALILGVLTGVAAFGGLMMNASFMLAGTASANPVLAALAIMIILGWKVAGHWGFDRFLLPALGAPWSPGYLLRRDKAEASRNNQQTAAS